jgi:phospholipid/cholesterol/gamma-HCH transport system permease protein
MKIELFFQKLGQQAILFFTGLHDLYKLFISTLQAIPSAWFYRRQLVEQFYGFLVKTIPISMVIAIFVGLGAFVQGSYQSSSIIPRYITISVIFKSTILELCPITLALVLAGKLGASLAAEVGSMKISDQIEALHSISLDPVGFLVLPRVAAGFLMLPIITIFANLIALFTVFFSSVVLSDWIAPGEFIKGLQYSSRPFELYFGSLIKPAVFGFVIALIGSFYGLRTYGGARGVGRSSTNAVVVAATIIVFFNYFLGRLFL